MFTHPQFNPNVCTSRQIPLNTEAKTQFLKLEENNSIHSITTVCTDPENERYALGFSNGIVKIYEQQFTLEIDLHKDNQRFNGIEKLMFINKTHIAIATEYYKIFVWDINNVKCCAELSGHSKKITAFAISKDKFLFSASQDKTVRIWDLETFQCKTVVEAYNSTLNYGVSDYLLNVLIKYYPSNKSLHYLTGLLLLSDQDDWINCLSTLSDGRVICGSKNAVITILDENGNCKAEAKIGEKSKSKPPGIDWYGGLHQHIEALYEYQNMIISSSRDGTIKILDKDTLQCKSKFHTPLVSNSQKPAKITCANIINDYLIVFSYSQQKLFIWDLPSLQLKQAINKLPGIQQICGTIDDAILMVSYKVNDPIYFLALHDCLKQSNELEINLQDILENANVKENKNGMRN